MKINSSGPLLDRTRPQISDRTHTLSHAGRPIALTNDQPLPSLTWIPLIRSLQSPVCSSGPSGAWRASEGEAVGEHMRTARMRTPRREPWRRAVCLCGSVCCLCPQHFCRTCSSTKANSRVVKNSAAVPCPSPADLDGEEALHPSSGTSARMWCVDLASDDGVSDSTASCATRALTLGEVRTGSASADRAVGSLDPSDIRRLAEACSAGLDPSQCERNPSCTRGFKHGGRGGHCRLQDGTARGAKRKPVVSQTKLGSLHRLAGLQQLQAIPLASTARTPRRPPPERRWVGVGGVARRDASGNGKPLPSSLVPPPDPIWDAERKRRRHALTRCVRFAPLPEASASKVDPSDDLKGSSLGCTVEEQTPEGESLLTIEGAHFSQGWAPPTSILKAGPPPAPVVRRALNVGMTVIEMEARAVKLDQGGVSTSTAARTPKKTGRKRARRGVAALCAPCERNLRCIRGYKHGGRGGHCSLRSEGDADEGDSWAANTQEEDGREQDPALFGSEEVGCLGCEDNPARGVAGEDACAPEMHDCGVGGVGDLGDEFGTESYVAALQNGLFDVQAMQLLC